MLICQFCMKECKNKNSLAQHERCCPSNPNRNYKNGMLGKKGTNQYSKAKELGADVKMSESTKQKISAQKKKNDLLRCDDEKREINQKISETISAKVSSGDWHTSIANRMRYSYDGEILHGKWEVAFAEWCDANNIPWKRCKRSFKYIFDGKERRYTPDFYLIDSEEFIEIKGYQKEKDVAKWSQFPKDLKLKVYFGDDLKALGVKI